MNRRDFFHRSAILAAGVVAADQLALLERLTHRRRFFPGWRVDPISLRLQRLRSIGEGGGWQTVQEIAYQSEKATRFAPMLETGQYQVIGVARPHLLGFGGPSDAEVPFRIDANFPLWVSRENTLTVASFPINIR